MCESCLVWENQIRAAKKKYAPDDVNGIDFMCWMR